MTLSVAARISIRRQFNAGVPHLDIAVSYGISVAMVLLIGNHRDQRGRVIRSAEPYQPPKPKDWKTARPAEDRIRRGEPCRSTGCEGTVERGSYCGHCAASIYAPRAA